MSTSIDSGSAVASASTDSAVRLQLDDDVAAASPMSATGTSTVTFSPRRTATRSTCSRKPLIGSRTIGLRQRELLALGGLQRDQRVGVAAQREHQLVARQGEVAGGVTVAVEDGRHLVGPADAPRRALAELGAGLGGDADSGHGGTLLERGAQRRGCGRDVLAGGAGTCCGLRRLPPRVVPAASRRRRTTSSAARAAGSVLRTPAGRRATAGSGGAVEQAGDRAVLEHLGDRAAEQRRDRQHGEPVEALLVGDRQGVGDDDLADAAVRAAGRSRGRTGRRGSR